MPNILDFHLLTDENIHPELVAYLRNKGFDVLDVKEQGWFGEKDSELLRISFDQNRVVITHDSDFGLLAIMKEHPFIGIIYIRPGDIHASKTIQQFDKFIDAEITLKTRFMIVIQETKIRIRYIEEEE